MAFLQLQQKIKSYLRKLRGQKYHVISSNVTLILKYYNSKKIYLSCNIENAKLALKMANSLSYQQHEGRKIQAVINGSYLLKKKKIRYFNHTYAWL